MVKLLTPLWRLACVLACAFAMTAGVIPGAGSNRAEASCLPSVIQQRLSQINAKFGKIRIVSTMRRGARIAGTGRKSYHASCRAVDFTPPPGKYAAVANWLKANHSGGVGTYSCGMHHIHIDNGPRVRFHKCVGRSGGRHQHASRRSNRKFASASRRESGRTRTARSRSASTRTAQRRGASSIRVANRGQNRVRTAKRLAEPKKLHFDLNGYTLVN